MKSFNGVNIYHTWIYVKKHCGTYIYKILKRLGCNNICKNQIISVRPFTLTVSRILSQLQAKRQRLSLDNFKKVWYSGKGDL